MTVSTQRLGDLARVLRGHTAANTVPEPDGPRFFGIAEISARGLSRPRYVSDEADLEKAVFLAEGDVVMGLLGKIGDATVIDDASIGAVLGRECAALRVLSPDSLRQVWLSAWMTSEEFTSQAAQHASGTTMTRLPARALENFTVTLPPVGRQLEIEQLVHSFDRAISTTATALEQLQALRGAELQLALANLEDDD